MHHLCVIIVGLAGLVYGQSVENVVIKPGEPYLGLKTPGYPNSAMPFNTVNVWNLKVEGEGARMKIRCDDIRMGQHEPWTDECEFVHVSFIDNGEETRICGPNKGGSNYTSKGTQLTVKMVAKTGSGLVRCMAFNTKEPEPIYIDLETGGRVKSLRTPDNPIPNFDRVWILNSPKNTRISLQCSLSLITDGTCFSESLTIDTDDGTKVYCGSRQVVAFTKGNTGRVRLTLDENGDHTVKCAVQAVTGPHANEFMNALLGEQEDSSEFGVTPGTRATSCKCGWRNRSPGRIIRGDETVENEFPWMVLLNLYTEFEGRWYGSYCGGSIISRRHVLTAAHCVYNKFTKQTMDPEGVTVVVGEHHTNIDSGREQHITAREVYIHDNYLKRGSHDIALIFTKDEIKFNDFIGPVCISNTFPSVLHRRVKIMGWGQTERGQGSDVLLKTSGVVVDNQLCHLPDFEMCIYGNATSSCYGDSGGPLVWRDPDTNRYLQLSLVSRGTHPVCEKGQSIYTNVYYFYDWIQNIIQMTDPGSQTCEKI